MDRYNRYKQNLFIKKFNWLEKQVNRDKLFPSNLKKCFLKLGINPDTAVDCIVHLASEVEKDDESFFTLCKFLISIGFVIGKQGSRKISSGGVLSRTNQAGKTLRNR